METPSPRKIHEKSGFRREISQQTGQDPDGFGTVVAHVGGQQHLESLWEKYLEDTMEYTMLYRYTPRICHENRGK